MRKKLLVVSAVMLLFVLCVSVKLFFIGEPIDGNQLFYEITMENRELSLHVNTAESAVALRSWKLSQKGPVLYISARKVLVSPLFRSGFYETVIPTGGLSEIYLGGKCIWTK